MKNLLVLTSLMFSAVASASSVTLEVSAITTFKSAESFEDGTLILIEPKAYGYQLGDSFTTADLFCELMDMNYLTRIPVAQSSGTRQVAKLDKPSGRIDLSIVTSHLVISMVACRTKNSKSNGLQ